MLLWRASGLLILVWAIALHGCGDSTAEDIGYKEVLTSFQQAAASQGPYGAVRRSADLPVGEHNVIRAFCSFADQIRLNRSAWKLEQQAYVVGRIRADAYNLGGAESAHIRRAVRQLDAVVDLASLNGRTLAGYREAC